LTEGGSEEGGLEELVEFLLTRSSNSAMRCSKDWTNAETLACASGDNVSQRCCGSGIWSLMLLFYRPLDEEAITGHERLLESIYPCEHAASFHRNFLGDLVSLARSGARN
jgi:hypothetical protein